jgi:hypothetical protein
MLIKLQKLLMLVFTFELSVKISSLIDLFKVDSLPFFGGGKMGAGAIGVIISHMIFKNPMILLYNNNPKQHLVPKYSGAASHKVAPPLSFLDPVS